MVSRFMRDRRPTRRQAALDSHSRAIFRAKGSRGCFTSRFTRANLCLLESAEAITNFRVTLTYFLLNFVSNDEDHRIY